jgi:Fe-S-cluster formation regulator IscX/YfhJ
MAFVYNFLDPEDVQFVDFRQQCGVTDWNTMNKDGKASKESICVLLELMANKVFLTTL